MNNNKITFAIGGIVIGLILGMIVSPMMRGNPAPSNNISDSSAKTVGVSALDRHFIEQMIPHHEGAIDMANLALEKAKRPEIKALAQAIVGAQESENQQMKSWYKDWFGKDVPKGSAMMGGMMSQGGMHMGGSEDLTALQNATDFDKAFIEQMIPHHQMAIMMARMLESGSEKPEMQQLAKNIISSQTKEIQDMQSWYSTWYK